MALVNSPTKVETEVTLTNCIITVDKPRPLFSRDVEAHAEMFYADEWQVVGDAMNDQEGGSFSTQTGTVYQALDVKSGSVHQIKASDVVAIDGLPEPLGSGDGLNMFNLTRPNPPEQE